jgi:O-antigen/teichoic acid export membrane protein
LVFYLFQQDFRDKLIHVFLLSLLTAVNGFHNFILLGRERIRSYNFLTFFQPAVAFLALLLGIFYFDLRGLTAPVLALYISQGACLLFSGVVVLRSLGGNGETEYAALPILKNGAINQLGNLAHILSNRYNFYVISALGFSLVGVYSSATSLIESVLIISASISPLILTHVANKRDTANDARITLLMARISFLLSFICILILYFVPADFFTEMLGKDFSQVKSVMLYLSPGVLALSFSGILSHYFSGLGEQRILLRANASGLLVTLVSSFFLVQRFGLTGACIAASGSYFVQALVLSVIFFRRHGFSFLNFGQILKDLQLLKK